MDNNIKKHINSGILGNQSENPYTDLVNGQQAAQQNGQMPPQQNGQMPMQQQPQMPAQPINHQAAFEEQMRREAYDRTQQPQQPIQDDNSYAFEQTGTYCRTGTLDNGFIETDLQIYKEKGRETRFISFSILSLLDEAQIEEIKKRNGMASLTMIITSEEQFNKFKEFVGGLNWND